MPNYNLTILEYSKYNVKFEADSLEHAKQLAQENLDEISDADSLPNAERYFRQGNETWEIDEIQEDN
jgi:hypothetical protein